MSILSTPLASLALLAAAALPQGAAAQDLRQQVTDAMPALMDLYRHLHAHPELSFQEVETAKTLATRMRGLGFTVTEKVGRTGVVAVLNNGPGPVVLLRTDMDGLPVTEQTGLPFASRVRGTQGGTESGVMHACAHDTHMTAWIGTAEVLAARKDQWRGTLVMVAQPAEELGEGAAAMLADGLYTRFPRPDHAITFHNAAQYPAGMVGIVSGYAMANVDSVDIVVRGVGGHGAYPHTTKDPVVLASAIVMKLQTLVSRESNPLEPAVVTVGAFHAGTKHNVIADEARLQLTVRSYADESRKMLLDGIARIARGEAIAAGLPEDRMPVVTVEETWTPAVYNTPDLSTRALALFRGRFGEDRVRVVDPVMGGEDFSQYRRADPDKVQSLLFWIGGAPQAKYDAAQAGGAPLPSLHSAVYAPDADKVISTAVEALSAAALDLMPVR